jgi:hypothetical protein
MPSLYRFKDERIQDVMLAYTNVENSVRYSLTHGGRYMPYDEQELEMMREDKAWAMARLVIDKIMRLTPIENFKPKN